LTERRRHRISAAACALILLGSEPPPDADSVMAKADFTLPSTTGRSHHSSCAAMPGRASRFILPSSGGEQFIASAPKIERAASSYILTQAAIGGAMPPNSLGDCGAHSPIFLPPPAPARVAPAEYFRDRKNFLDRLRAVARSPR